MTEVFGVKIPMDPWVVLPMIVLATAVVAYLVNLTILRILTNASKRMPSQIDERIFPLVERYLFPILTLAGLMLIADAFPLPPGVLAALDRLLLVLAVVLGVFLATRAALFFLRSVQDRYESLQNIKAPVEIATKSLFIVIGGMIILDSLGVSITPLLTTLGIGSLAVAIALQDTLGNFFAGLYIKADRPFQTGDYIRLESGEEGYVAHIGWRNTRIRMLPNNMVIVPNNKLVQSHITNYYLPDREIAVLVQVGVDYASDLQKVERVTCEVAKEVLGSVPGAVREFEPFIRYHTFNQSSIDFSVILRGREFTDNFLIKHEFIKKLHARYKREGITIPFPIRTIYMDSERDGKREERPIHRSDAEHATETGSHHERHEGEHEAHEENRGRKR
ncbi:MAG TPA: mechanosensitive ion channel family protein [Candidatus Eisenbacteria bacterium]|nr:mechanosensitive ion channel family protein [Candidatus Eisenbacteria bacterium]